jgi:hypothetical protein
MIDVAEWVKTFRAVRGRSPAILHVGNIANNAYLNARILNDAGIDCDVLSDNFYHIMGSPEWEEADFDAAGLDYDRPDWDRVSLRSYRRPRWFAQGPLSLGVRYLRARRQKKQGAATVWWQALAARRYASCSSRLTPLRSWYQSRPRSAPQAAQAATPLVRTPAAGEQRFMRAFAEAFPDRADQLQPADLTEPARRADCLGGLLGQYDLVHAYGAEPVLPLLAGTRPYVAFEHGTLREIPFRADAFGRLTALAYRLADQVIITNADNRAAAQRLGLTQYRFVPHAVNERRPNPVAAAALRQRWRERLSADFVVFHPSRHHWDPQFRDPNYEKGNDILIRGFAQFARQRGVAAGAVFVEWGQKVADSKRLLEACGIADRVLWVPPLPRSRMYDAIEATDVVADQFALGAFGNITPQALFAGRPALLRLDENAHRWCFAEMPPVLNASTPDAVCDQLLRVYRDPACARALSAAGQTWYARYHSAAVVRDGLLATYADALGEPRPLPQHS